MLVITGCSFITNKPNGIGSITASTCPKTVERKSKQEQEKETAAPDESCGTSFCSATLPAASGCRLACSHNPSPACKLKSSMRQRAVKDCIWLIHFMFRNKSRPNLQCCCKKYYHTYINEECQLLAGILHLFLDKVVFNNSFLFAFIEVFKKSYFFFIKEAPMATFHIFLG